MTDYDSLYIEVFYEHIEVGCGEGPAIKLTQSQARELGEDLTYYADNGEVSPWSKISPPDEPRPVLTWGDIEFIPGDATRTIVLNGDYMPIEMELKDGTVISGWAKMTKKATP